jgi:hypothetical protein
MWLKEITRIREGGGELGVDGLRNMFRKRWGRVSYFFFLWTDL